MISNNVGGQLLVPFSSLTFTSGPPEYSSPAPAGYQVSFWSSWGCPPSSPSLARNSMVLQLLLTRSYVWSPLSTAVGPHLCTLQSVLSSPPPPWAGKVGTKLMSSHCPCWWGPCRPAASLPCSSSLQVNPAWALPVDLHKSIAFRLVTALIALLCTASSTSSALLFLGSSSTLERRSKIILKKYSDNLLPC